MRIIYTAFILFFSLNSLNCLAQQTVGLFTLEEGSQDGYVLFSPMLNYDTYLIDKCGKVVNSWETGFKPGLSAYLLPDGNLLRTGVNLLNLSPPHFGPGFGGVIEKYDWDNNLLWTYGISDSVQIQHHDICPLPNGNILALIWEKKLIAAATEEGINTGIATNMTLNEKIVELQPYGNDSAVIIWEWEVWDHLIQDYDVTKNNYGVVTDHPELVNINYSPQGSLLISDWLHVNSIAYNAALDQIVMSVHNFSEVWIIDHSTTTSEAASHAGGNSGKGGDLLYRWGNPQAYGTGTNTDKKLFGQHDVNWIHPGFPGEHDLILFNNGLNRPAGNFSSIETVAPPVDMFGNYSITSGEAYLPLASSWTYEAPVREDFFSMLISGAQRLSNGNTLICEGLKGNLFEIDEDKNIVWKYISPVSDLGILNQGDIANNNQVFRCTLYEPDYPAFIGKDMTPGSVIELNPTPGPCDVVSINNSKVNRLSVEVFPNPFENSVTIKPSAEMKNVSLELSNAEGMKVYSEQIASIKANEPYLLKSEYNLVQGLYFLSVRNETGSSVIKILHN